MSLCLIIYCQTLFHPCKPLLLQNMISVSRFKNWNPFAVEYVWAEWWQCGPDLIWVALVSGWVVYGDWTQPCLPSHTSSFLSLQLDHHGVQGGCRRGWWGYIRAIGCSGYGVYGADMGYMGQCLHRGDVYGAPSSGYMEQVEEWALYCDSTQHWCPRSPPYPSSQSPPWSRDIPPSPQAYVCPPHSFSKYESLVIEKPENIKVWYQYLLSSRGRYH